MHGQVIKPPNAKDIPCSAIRSHLQAPTIQTRQTREDSKKYLWQKKSLAKLQSDTLWRQELQKLQSMESTIDSRADFHDMASNKPKAKINQKTEISDKVLPLQRGISPSGNSGGDFDTKITCDLAGLSNSPFSIDQRWMASRSSFTQAIKRSSKDRFPDK
jgi:hypothetical protein